MEKPLKTAAKLWIVVLIIALLGCLALGVYVLGSVGDEAFLGSARENLKNQNLYTDEDGLRSLLLLAGFLPLILAAWLGAGIIVDLALLRYLKEDGLTKEPQKLRKLAVLCLVFFVTVPGALGLMVKPNPPEDGPSCPTGEDPYR